MINGNNGSKQRGQSLVLVAASMVILVLFVAITVDVSNAYRHRRIAQNGADGAALAGARQLVRQKNRGAFTDALVQEEMNDFAERNGISDTDGILANAVNLNVEGYYLDEAGDRIQQGGADVMVGNGAVPANAWGVEAVTHIAAPTFFGGLFGLDGLALQAEAAVTLQNTCGLGCVVPIATYFRWFEVWDPDTETPCYNIWNGIDPGNFGWLNWSRQGNYCDTDDCSAVCLGDNLDHEQPCSSGWIEVGDWVAGSTGTVNDVKVRRELQYYIDTPQPFTVIVWDVTNGEGGCGPSPNGLEYHVAAFARMQLLGYQLSQGVGAGKYGHDGTGCVDIGYPEGWPEGEPPNNGVRLTAYFLEWVDPTGGGTCTINEGSTLRSPILTK